MDYSKEAFEADSRRYREELARLRGLGYADAHPLVRRQIRRIEVVERVLTDPRFGLAQAEGGG